MCLSRVLVPLLVVAGVAHLRSTERLGPQARGGRGASRLNLAASIPPHQDTPRRLRAEDTRRGLRRRGKVWVVHVVPSGPVGVIFFLCSGRRKTFCIAMHTILQLLLAVPNLKSKFVTPNNRSYTSRGDGGGTEPVQGKHAFCLSAFSFIRLCHLVTLSPCVSPAHTAPESFIEPLANAVGSICFPSIPC